MSRATAASEAFRVTAKFRADTFLTYVPVRELRAGQGEHKPAEGPSNMTDNGAPPSFTMLAAVRDAEPLDPDARAIIADIANSC